MEDKKDISLRSSPAITADVSAGFVVQASFLRKAERLVAAIYLVTDCVPDNEVLRLRLRESALGLISDIVHIHPALSDKRAQEVRALISVARQIGFISEMNALILLGELEKLGEGVRDQYRTPRHLERMLENQFPDDEYKGQKYKRHFVIKDKQKTRALHKTDTSSFPRKRGKRRDTIVDLIRKVSLVTVKDVSLVIRDCSEKTLQRELIALVNEGVLKREGERRWSKYSLSEAPRVSVSL